MTVYYYDSTMPGAPEITGTAGALQALLKACLVDGFGAAAVTSITVAGGVATATYASQHPFRVGSIAAFAGAVPAGLNGQKRVMSITTNAVTFAAPGVPDGAATGTITSKVAPAGWQEVFPGSVTNVIVLKPSVPEATGCLLRVDDTQGLFTRVAGYESMTDANTGGGRFPQTTQATSLHWPKSYSGSTTKRPWRLIADERFVMWFCQSGQEPNSQPYGGFLYGFGDMMPYKSSDTYACMITGCSSSDFSNAQFGDLSYGSGSSYTPTSGLYLPRGFNGIGGSIAVQITSAHNTAQAYSGGGSYRGNSFRYPNPVDNSLRIGKVEAWSPDEGLRGILPGVYHCAQHVRDTFKTGDVLAGQGEFAGKTFVVLRCTPSAGYPATLDYGASVVFVDISGPWR